MRLITLKVTFHELELLTTLVADQLFRREFIDPRLSGSNANPAELSLGKKLVERLRLLADRAKETPLPGKGLLACRVAARRIPDAH
jgi:hypothetical protein